MLEYEFETVACDFGGGYSLFGGVGLETEGHREIILRRYYRDEKPRAIARALGLSVKQVDNRLYRAKAKLRSSIQL